MLTSHKRALQSAGLIAAISAATVLGISGAASADNHHGHGGSTPSPTATSVCTPAPTSEPTTTPSSTPTAAPTTPASADSAPTGDIGDFTQTFVENFDTTAAANGPFAKTYAGSWQPYADGTGNEYYSGSQISAHDGYMDVTLDGTHGAAGTFGTPDDAWAHVGGKFTIRARATGGTGNGVAVMLWPSSNVWADGEIDYPEGNFEDTAHVYQHSMVPGQEASAQTIATGTKWSDWHTYSEDWIPGKSMKYYLDGTLIFSTTTNVPTTGHRYMFQVGNWGAAGHFDVDWVTTYDYAG
jgi:hypothetical protein